MALKREKTEAPPLTISKELFKLWKANKRLKDTEEIMKLAKKAKLPSSKVTIDKALLHGYCPNDDLRDVITNYFADRNNKEKESMGKLIESMKGHPKHSSK